MNYYNRDGRKLDLFVENLVYLRSGYHAQVFHDASRAFKKYYQDVPTTERISLPMFDYLRGMHHPHLITLDDAYCELEEDRLFLLQNQIIPFQVDAYTSAYYVDPSINVLLASTDYLIDNFRELDLLLETFTRDGVMVTDLFRKNVILDPDHMILIDPDGFRIEETMMLSYQNKKRLVGLLKDICRSAAFHTPEVAVMPSKVMNLLDIEVHQDTDVAYELFKKLRSFSRPIDYLKEK